MKLEFFQAKFLKIQKSLTKASDFTVTIKQENITTNGEINTTINKTHQHKTTLYVTKNGIELAENSAGEKEHSLDQ